MHGDEEDTDRMIDAIIRDFPGYVPGTRPSHAVGIVLAGSFVASDVAQNYSRARHFSSDRIPVVVRFSNSSGLSVISDPEDQVRGMAVKFLWFAHDRMRHTDLVSSTLPCFPVRTEAAFLEFAQAAVPRPVRTSLLGRLYGMLLGVEPPLVPAPGRKISAAEGVADYATAHREAIGAVLALANPLIPDSYAHCRYHAIHAFTLTNKAGATSIGRFSWEPVDGATRVERPEGGIDLLAEMQERVQHSSVEFVLRLQLADRCDDPADPTTPWPGSRKSVVMGRLKLRNVIDDSRCRRLSFNPMDLVEGIDSIAGDDLICLRAGVYRRSVARRLGAP
jgi:catalase